jgi:hypothetical protein
MRAGIEIHRNNSRVRIRKHQTGKGTTYAVEVYGQVSNIYGWMKLATARNIKQARAISTCFVAIVEQHH